MAPGLPLPKNLSEFCDPKYWDSFFKLCGGRPFEWYGDWRLIRKLVTEQCQLKSNSEEKILIPGCGNSSLSEDMYDAGFIHITNIDFSRVVISEMLRKHVRSRSNMRWLVMDMTKMQFPDHSFDVVVDKGGLDALLGEPEEDCSSGVSFLSEVKRVLRPSGRFACITLAQKHIIELLLRTFREGWQLSVHGLQLSAADAPSSLQPFLVIARQESRITSPLVAFDLDLNWRGSSNKFQMQAVVEAVDAENALRRQGPTDSTIPKGPQINPEDLYEDLYEKLHPGRRLTAKLGNQKSQFTYTAVILDAEDIRADYQCAVFLVPLEELQFHWKVLFLYNEDGREDEWLFSSVEGQWQLVESSKAGRLILVELRYHFMIALDADHYVENILNVKDDLSPLVKCFLPLDSREGGNVPYMTRGDEISAKNILAEIGSPMTGAMVVEDVVLANGTDHEHFRRLVFRRNPYLIQSEALLVRAREISQTEDKGRSIGEVSRKQSTSKRKKKANKEITSMANPGISQELKVDHNYLASPYHAGMIAAFVLIAKNLEGWLASKQQVRLMLVGLGAGLLPMFVHKHLPIDIQVVELDPVVGDVAKLHFGFIEDDRMKLHIGDGVVAVKSIAAAVSPPSVQEAPQDDSHGPEQISSKNDPANPCGQTSNDEDVSTISKSSENRESTPLQDAVTASQIEEEGSTDSSLELSERVSRLEVRDSGSRTLTSGESGADLRLHVLIVDADSGDRSSGLSCPPAEFLEESFLLAARAALVDGGMLIINVVTRSTSHHVQHVTQLKRFFEELYDIQVNGDMNRVLIALPQSRNIGHQSSNIMNDLAKLEKIMRRFRSWGNGPNLKEILRNLRRLK